MPLSERPRNHHRFNRCVNELSDIISFEQPEKLSEFIRRIVKWLLEQSPITKRARRIISDGEMTFQKHPGPFLLPEFELDFFSAVDKKTQTPMATVKFRDGYYRGLPDGYPTIVRIEEIPQLVIRRLIYADAVRGGGYSEWSEIRHNGNGDLLLDFQLPGRRKYKRAC